MTFYIKSCINLKKCVWQSLVIVIKACKVKDRSWFQGRFEEHRVSLEIILAIRENINENLLRSWYVSKRRLYFTNIVKTSAWKTVYSPRWFFEIFSETPSPDHTSIFRTLLYNPRYKLHTRLKNIFLVKIEQTDVLKFLSKPSSTRDRIGSPIRHFPKCFRHPVG